MAKITGSGHAKSGPATLEGFGVVLRGYVDNSTPEAAQATGTALHEIESWVDDARPLDY